MIYQLILKLGITEQSAVFCAIKSVDKLKRKGLKCAYENWDKTHKLAGKLWIIGGIVMTIAGLLNFTILFMIIIFAIVIIPTIYSYLLYRNKRSEG